MEEKYAGFWKGGEYKCVKCGSALFNSESKFKSGTGWPSFRNCVKGSIKTRPDYSHGMARTEILCAKCSQHLGHVFDDGRQCGDSHPEAGARFCVLSKALKFDIKKKPMKCSALHMTKF